MSRIIAGRAKGQRLATPKGDRTRPTTDRVREALFSALASWFGTAEEPAEHHLDGVAVLDLFAGSGAVGLEAASRGAARVTLVEADAPTAKLVRSNARAIGASVDVVTGRLPSALSSVGGGWDLVFADPPYDLADELLAELLEQLAGSGALAPKALVVVERAKRSPVPSWPAHFTDTWVREYGETVLHFGATN